jgi:hypothetical protein
MAQARTEAEIRRAFDATVAAIDESVDTVHGPIPFAIRNPVAAVLTDSEQQAVHLIRLHSTRFLSEADEDEFQAISDNFAKSPKLGKPSSGRLVAWTTKKPQAGEVRRIEAGHVATTRNRDLEYVLVEAAVMDGDQADNYYNAAKRRWEVSVLAESIGTGSQFDVPPLRINKLDPPVSGFDGIENLKRFRRGSQQETRVQLFTRLQNALLSGIDRGTSAGHRAFVLSEAAAVAGDGYEDSAISITFVFPSDKKEFKRRVDGPAMDIILLVSDAALNDGGTDEFFASPGQTDFVLTRQPVRSIVSVKVNNVAITSYTFVKDVTEDFGWSGKANDKVVLNAGLNENDSLIVQYEYNELVSNMQDSADGGDNLFRSDVLYREPKTKQIRIQVEITPLTSTPPEEADIKEDVGAVITSYITGGLAGVYTPETLRTVIQEKLGFTAIVRILKMYRLVDGVAELEVIRLLKNETAELVFDSDDDVIVRR